jgi:predicted DNA-binding transcriptional regulator AlpA
MDPARPFDLDFVTARDVAELLCVSPRTVWRWSATGRLPAPVRVGARCTRWRVSDLQRYFDALVSRVPDEAGELVEP